MNMLVRRKWEFKRLLGRRMCSSKQDLQSQLREKAEEASAQFWKNKYVHQAHQMNSKWGWAVGIVGVASLTVVAFSSELKGGVSRHTADVASRSLQDEALLIQTQQLASDIVHTVLTNPKVLDQASQFITHLVELERTQQSLVRLTKYVLNDPHTLAEVTKLSKQLLYNLIQDPATLRQLTDLLKAAIMDPTTKQSLVSLLDVLMKDEYTQKNLTQLLQYVFVQDAVKDSVTVTLTDTVHTLLGNQEVQDHSKVFVSDVLKDRTLQSQGGEAVWNTVWYSITPRWITWFGGSSQKQPQQQPPEA